MNKLMRLLDIIDFDEDGDLVVTGVNLRVVNGEAETYSGNGKGNVIVGYDAVGGSAPRRGGSHNVIVGDGHGYAKNGCLFSGRNHTALQDSAAFIGGARSVIRGSAPLAAVVGGMAHDVGGVASTVVGGRGNLVTAERVTVVGAVEQHARTASAFVSPNARNVAKFFKHVSVSGDSIHISGANLHIRNGANSATENGKGNILFGYSKEAPVCSHKVVPQEGVVSGGGGEKVKEKMEKEKEGGLLREAVEDLV